MSGLSSFRFVRTVGTVLTAESLVSASELRMPGQSAADYQLPPGMAVNGAVARAWDTMLAAHREWHKALEKLPDGDPAIKVTREKWLLPLLYELGWGRVEAVPAGLEVQPDLGDTTPLHFPVSHRWSYPDASNPTAWVPLHLLGAGVNLDTKTANVTARAPQSMVQDYLNRETRALWAILSNGRQLRLLRDASALTRQSHVEFDLDEIFANQLYADFRLLFLTAHASRFAPQLTAAGKKLADAADDADSDETDGDETDQSEARIDLCWVERWRVRAIDIGSRARLNLQDGIAVALEHLGNGFLACPDNTSLREHLANASDADRDLHRALLRIAYRLIVLFVAEDRGLLHTDDVPSAARERYAEYFSTTRLRGLVGRHAGGRHTDLWQAHQIVTDALAGDGLRALGLSGLGATLFGRQYLGILDGTRLPNYAFLAAIKALSQIKDPITGTPRPVDYQNLDSEEFGGMYEGLLAYTPRYNPAEHSFTFTVASGNDRKKSGSYYTPAELIDVVLSEVLDPMITEALSAKAPEDRENALLNVTVVDPACGSGHFVVAAARRLATALAEVRTGDTEPSPAAVRAATADVIERCMYGVDLNDLAIEITKVALWLEAFDAGRPFPFLDAHFRVGNALLGTTPALLKNNIPDVAFAVLGDDDKDWTSKLKSRNKGERRADDDQLSLSFGPEALDVSTSELHRAAQDADRGTADSLFQLRARADAWRRLEDDPDLQAKKLVADAWCAAFVQPKRGHDVTGQGITYRTLQDLAQDPKAVPDRVVETIRILARRYRFFHWHLEFPGIFTVDGTQENSSSGWRGGFSCVVGNPPWERVKLQDKEFFGNIGRSDIQNAPTAAIRKKMIEKLAAEDWVLHAAYRSALRQSDATAHFLLKSARYPLTGQGDVNTYSVFAETMRTVTSPDGAAGFVTPTGIATDKTTAPFFADTLSNRRLYAFHDFENHYRIFADVNDRVRFAITCVTGPDRQVARTRFSFLNHRIADLPTRLFELAADEVLMLNPNTGTLPMFRTRPDAEITLGIYRRHPVLIRDNEPSGNPWGLSFLRLFDMTNDSGLFQQPEDIPRALFNGWSFTDGGCEYVPLYEAKMLWYFDHRFSTFQDATKEQISVGLLPRLSDKEHDDPHIESKAKFWVERGEVHKRLEAWDRDWLLGVRAITNSGNERTFVPSVLPASAVGNSFLVAIAGNPLAGAELHGVWSSLVFDYIARQKLSGPNVNQFFLKQLACLTPRDFEAPTAWKKGESLREWLKPYLLELSYTSWRLQPYALDLGDSGAPFHWNSDRRAMLRADVEAGFFHSYGLNRGEVEHVLDAFDKLKRHEERDLGEYRTKHLVLEAYDRMTPAIANGGTGWEPLADPPAGQGPRHKNP
jgi:hypothetical protein